MLHIKLRLWLTALVLFVALAALIGGGETGRAGAFSMPDAEKVLEIERYPNEPFELVDINVGTRSVKHTVKTKRMPGSDWWRDIVTFRENNGWIKNVKIRLRNISGKPIYGLTANFHFQSPTEKLLFGMQLTRMRNLGVAPLQPNEEIDLTVSDRMLDDTKTRIQQAGLDIDSLPVSMSVDSASFSETLMWYRGSMVERDSENPNKWTPVKREP